MTQFIYLDSQERAYPSIIVGGSMLIAEPGQTYDLDSMPDDGRWSNATATPSPEVTQTAPIAPETPATPPVDPTPTTSN